MADENYIEKPSTSNLNAESLESTIKIHVKTLDSQIYCFRVDRNMSVPSLKEKIASATGVPVEQQRLIFRGKVLKDDELLSGYHVEDGHTLHLVVRPQVQSQAPTRANSGVTNGNTDNRGNDASAGAPRSRMGISRSVVLGSFNVGDHGAEGSGPDLSRIIGAVLNSIGISNQNPIGGANIPSSGGANIPSGIPSNASTQASQGVESGGTPGNNGGRSQPWAQIAPGQAFANHPFQSRPQSLHFPLPGAAVVVPSPQMPIPDALHTLSDFINRMELALSATGYWPSPSPSNVGDQQRENVPLNAWGLPTPEALSVILRRAQQLISGHAVAALSHIAGRLEGDRGSTDPAVRNEIQTESVQVGLAMQHLGSLFLELGRTILTIRMGQSPADSLVNAGPAVYISSAGPNPIMVQPFPLQTSSLFGGPASSQANPGVMGPLGPGDAQRSVNIHIHAVGSRAVNGEHAHQETPNGSRSGDSGSTRVVPLMNVIGAAVPSHSRAEGASQRTRQNTQTHTPPAQSTGVGTFNTLQPNAEDSAPQSLPEPVSAPILVAEISTQIRNVDGDMLGENQVPSGQSVNSIHLRSPSETSMWDNQRNHQENLAADGADKKEGCLTDPNTERAEQQQPESHQRRNEGESSGIWSSNEASSISSTGTSSSSHNLPCKSEDAISLASKSSHSHDSLEADKAVPLGLGLGGLQPKRRSRQVKSQGKNASETSGVQPANENQQLIASGQQVLQSLISRGSNANTREANAPPGQLQPVSAQSMPMEAPDSIGQFDAASMMSQVLNSPALNGLLAGVSEQAGIGSPDGLRNMLEQFTQSPSMRNTLNQIVQQIDGQGVSNLSGMARGQGGGIDLSRMVQNMMPIVSQALTGLSTAPEPSYSLESREQQQYGMTGLARVDKPNQNSQIDLQQIVQRIEHNDPPQDIFRMVIEHAASLCSEGDYQDLVEDLCKNEDLVSEYMEMLHGNGCH